MYGFGFFLYNVLDRFDKICSSRGLSEYVSKYEKIREELKITLNTKAWDGEWFKRAFTDEGKVLGTAQNTECRIDSIAQSWAVISNAGDSDKASMALDSLDKHLVDRSVRNY